MCKFCKSEFKCKPSSKQQYCCKKCASNARKGINFKRVQYVKVTCCVCGKEEYVSPSRAKKYKTCSIECQHKFIGDKFSKKITCQCAVCGKELKLKPTKFNNSKTHCCSKRCNALLKSATFCGQNNHQFGLKGELNASFKNKALSKKNGHQADIFVYDPNSPDNIDNPYTYGRVKQHRKVIYDNKNYFNQCIFGKNGKILQTVNIHHIDSNHNHNTLDNLVPLTRKQHKITHTKLGYIAHEIISSLIGVFKQGELLENPEVDNQQPSLYGNIFEGSETNSRIQLDSNADTSALLQNIIAILNDYIVQTRNITKDAYNASIQEILESGIKSPETIQRITEEN